MTIVKRGSKFRVISKEGKNLGESDTKAGAAKRLGEVEWFKHHAKCIVDPDLVKGNDGMQQYVPVVFQINKPQDREAQKLDFPSSTKQMELRDVKQPEFPSTPFTGEAYSQSFHNPRPSPPVKDGAVLAVQPSSGNYNPGAFRGEHGPDIQHKGSDYAPKKAKKSIMIAGKKVMIIKGSEGSDNTNFQDRYPMERGSEPRPFDPNEERQKREDWIQSEKMKEKTKAYEEAKRAYSPGNGPYGLAQGPDAYLGRSKGSKPVGEYTKDYPGAKVTFNQPIDPTKKPKKVFVHLTEQGREVKAKRTSKSKGIMKLVLQYTQNQPLAAGFKPLLAYLVKEEDNEKKEKAMSTGAIARKIGPPKGAMSPSRARLLRRGAEEEAEQSDTQRHDDAAGPHPDFGPHGGYKGDTKKLGKGAFKDKWIKQQEEAGKDPLTPPGKTKKRTNPLSIKEHTRRKEGSSGTGDPSEGWPPEGYKEKSDRPNPIKGGIGDKLDYKDVDQDELADGIEVEQEHVKNNPDLDEDEKRVRGADIAMDHLEEDPKYYTNLKEMERKAKEENKAETKKKKLLKIDQATKSFIFRKGKYSEDPERAGHMVGSIAYNTDVWNKYQSGKKEKQAERIVEKMDKKHGKDPRYQSAVDDVTGDI